METMSCGNIAPCVRIDVRVILLMSYSFNFLSFDIPWGKLRSAGYNFSVQKTGI